MAKMPTSYESELKKAERKRKIAEIMMQKGLTNQPNMQSWLQVLGQVGSAYAGKRMLDKADKSEEAITAGYQKDTEDTLAAIASDAGTMSPEALVGKYQQKVADNPALQQALKPYISAMTTSMTSGARIVNDKTEGYVPVSSLTGKGPRYDPNAMVNVVDGKSVINEPRITAAQMAQGATPGGGGATFHNNEPIPGMAQPPQGLPPSPADVPASAPTGGPPSDIDLNLLNPEERGILQQELKRRAGDSGAPSGPFTPPTPNIPMGNPLTAQRAPAGLINGKPYWMINGVPFDNPEGK